MNEIDIICQDGVRLGGHWWRTAALIEPADYGRAAIGHFNLFHDSHAAGFWTDTLSWLKDGRNPWRDLPL